MACYSLLLVIDNRSGRCLDLAELPADAEKQRASPRRFRQSTARRKPKFLRVMASDHCLVDSMAVVAAAGILSLGHLSEFLYWQF